MTIGETIYKNRKKAGISQIQLADMLNVSRQTISLWETDQTFPSTANLVRLTEIFNISMDELCGKEPTEAPKNDCVSETCTEYTKQLLTDMYLSIYGKFIAICCALIVITILYIVAEHESGATAAAIVLAVLLCCVIGLILVIKIGPTKSLKSYPNLKCTVKFYNDRFEVEAVSDSSNTRYSKTYDKIKKVYCTKNHIFINCDGIIIPIVKSNLEKNIYTVCKLLDIDYEEFTDKNKKKINNLLLAAFTISFVSIFMALAVCAICVQVSPLPQFNMTMIEYMWVFYLFIPLHLISAILGIVYLIKGYKCKKNVVAGFALTFIFAIFGSFAPFLGYPVKHDFNFVTEVAAELPIDLPDSGYVSYTLNNGENTLADAMVKFDDKQELLEKINKGNWKNSLTAIPSSIVPNYILHTTENYDCFYLYDVDCKKSNEQITQTHIGHVFIYLAYSEEINIMQILCFSI